MAAFLDSDDKVELVDQHVQQLSFTDSPDVVIIQVYITNAYRAYRIAEIYRKKGALVLLGGLDVTALPEEAEKFADVVFLGPAEESFPRFLNDLREGKVKKRYISRVRTLVGIPHIRRDLIDRKLYLVPNSLIISRGCPHSCNFCYKSSFFEGGKSFYTQAIDAILQEIEQLPGRHLYFLDDHLLGNRVLANDLFSEMIGMGRIFQGAATVKSVMENNLVEKAAEAGLRSLFVGFESVNTSNFSRLNKDHNLVNDHSEAIKKLHDLGIMINGSFVFGFDEDESSVFSKTVDWAINNGLTTSTFHIATPYPGTAFYDSMLKSGRLLTKNWDLYDTRHVVFQPISMTKKELEQGYQDSYTRFYQWTSVVKSSLHHGSMKHQLKHFFYAGGWKKFEPFWNFMIQMKKLNLMTPILEGVLSRITKNIISNQSDEPIDARRSTQHTTR